MAEKKKSIVELLEEAREHYGLPSPGRLAALFDAATDDGPVSHDLTEHVVSLQDKGQALDVAAYGALLFRVMRAAAADIEELRQRVVALERAQHGVWLKCCSEQGSFIDTSDYTDKQCEVITRFLNEFDDYLENGRPPFIFLSSELGSASKAKE